VTVGGNIFEFASFDRAVKYACINIPQIVRTATEPKSVKGVLNHKINRTNCALIPPALSSILLFAQANILSERNGHRMKYRSHNIGWRETISTTRLRTELIDWPNIEAIVTEGAYLSQVYCYPETA